MIYTVTTESGSKYVIDTDEMTWERLHVGDPQFTSRKSKGNLTQVPDIKLGMPMYLYDTDILPGYADHCVVTTPVDSIEKALED